MPSYTITTFSKDNVLYQAWAGRKGKGKEKAKSRAAAAATAVSWSRDLFRGRTGAIQTAFSRGLDGPSYPPLPRALQRGSAGGLSLPSLTQRKSATPLSLVLIASH